MNTTPKPLLRRARELYGESRHNRHAWVRSVLFLGNRWLLAQPVPRQL